MKKTTYEKVIALHDRGATPSKICERLDIHKSSVSKYLKAHREYMDSATTFRRKKLPKKNIKPISTKLVKVKKVRVDAWANSITGQNIRGRDRKASYEFIGQLAKSQEELDNFYRFNGLARKIIDLIPEEMIREWITIDGDTDGIIVEKLDQLRSRTLFKKFLSLDRLYGGSIIFMGIDDGNSMDMPVNENTIKSVNFLKVFDRFEVSRVIRFQDINSDDFGEIEFYFVKPELINTAPEIKIHSSRVLRLGGREVPDRIRISNDGWGDSQICTIFEQLKNIGIAYNSTADILETYDQGVLMMPNLVKMVAQGKEGIILNRLAALDMTKGIINSIAIGNDESYEKKTTSVSGLENLISTFEFALSAVTGIPHSKLFGEGASGLNNSGDSDIRNFYDNVRATQQEILQPNLDKLIRYIILSRDISLPSKDPDDYLIDFTSLWQLSELDQAELKLKNAETDKIYIETGVLDSRVITRSRFAGPEYSSEITLSENEEKALEEDNSTDTEVFNQEIDNQSIQRNEQRDSDHLQQEEEEEEEDKE